MVQKTKARPSSHSVDDTAVGRHKHVTRHRLAFRKTSHPNLLIFAGLHPKLLILKEKLNNLQGELLLETRRVPDVSTGL